MKIAQLTLSVLLLLPVAGLAVESSIRHVEIYPRGAAITRELTMEISGEGTQLVEVEDLPAGLLASSIQIAPMGNAPVRIGGFTFKPEGNPVEADDERTADLRDSIEAIEANQRLIKEEAEMIEGRIQHYNMIAQSIRKSLEETASPDAFELAQSSWAELESVKSAGTERLAELHKKTSELDRKLGKLREELGERVHELSRKSGILEIDLSAPAGPVSLLLRYQVREAGWSPVHEIRAMPTTGSVSWVYKARIHQDSGEDWTDVQVALNSASALNASGLPHLDPLFLSRQEPMVSYTQSMKMRSQDVLMEAAPAQGAMGGVPQSTTTGFFIHLPQPMSLESGRDPVVREAFTGELNAEFWSEAVPELSTEAWLMAGMVNDLGWPILPGESYSYIDGQLVAHRRIEAMAAGEDIELSLGRNEKISIERKERVRKESEGGLIDRTKRHDIKYETTVENRMGVAHRVVLKDRFPIGRDNKIQVKIISPKDVEPEEGTGVFDWEKTLQPGSSAVLTTEYTVSYPADWTVWPPLK